jgi:hypothetical protein
MGVLAITTAAAQTPAATEYQVKAAYLFNFGRFVQWPAAASPDGPFAICVLGHDPFGQILDKTLTGVSIDGKTVVARRIGKAQDVADCRIVFISLSETSQLKETLRALERTSALTVSDIPEFAQRGGAIQFVVTGKRVRFEINLTIAQSAGLVLSSDLLKVAIAVRKSAGAGD